MYPSTQFDPSIPLWRQLNLRDLPSRLDRVEFVGPPKPLKLVRPEFVGPSNGTRSHFADGTSRKQNNPATGKPFKYQDVREDGNIFRAYRTDTINKNGFHLETWSSPAAFERHRTGNNELNRKRYAENFISNRSSHFADGTSRRRNNPLTGKPFRFKDVREDGNVFRSYNLTVLNKAGFYSEIWSSPAAFEKNETSKSEYRIKRYAEDPTYTKAKSAQWCRNNPGKSAAKAAKYDASKIQRTPKWLTREQRAEMVTIYERCAQKTKETGVIFHVDHCVPLRGKTVCGLHVPWNLRIITASENCSKGNRVQE
jgi:hypothetical protein